MPAVDPQIERVVAELKVGGGGVGYGLRAIGGHKGPPVRPISGTVGADTKRLLARYSAPVSKHTEALAASARNGTKSLW